MATKEEEIKRSMKASAWRELETKGKCAFSSSNNEEGFHSANEQAVHEGKRIQGAGEVGAWLEELDLEFAADGKAASASA